jgi:hypothetical protein
VTWLGRDDRQVLALLDPWRKKERWRLEFAAGAKMARLGQDEVGVLDPQGRFIVLSLPSGKAVLEAKLQPRREVIDILALRSRDSYVLVVKQPIPAAPAGSEPDVIFPLSMGGRTEMVTGTLYGFDRKTGKQVWASSVVQQGLDLSQGESVPVLVFAQRSYSRKSGPGRYQGRILCLDKRDGRVLHEETLDQSVGQMQVVADAANHAVEIRTTRGGTKLTFTGKPTSGK